jgi:collagen triple helix repeat protein
MKLDMRVLGELVSTKLKGYVDSQLTEVRKENEGLRERVAQLEVRAATPLHPGQQGVRGEQGPVGPPGVDGASGPQGERGVDGAPGRDGQPGRDGRDGKDGEPGRDGLSVEDWTFDYDCERTITLSVKNASAHQVKSIKLPIMLDRGVYQQGKAYERGDCVTYGGSLWIAKKDGADRPGEGDTWRLAVKRGRDGKQPEVKK